MIQAELLNRIESHAGEWEVSIEDPFETESSVIAFGVRHDKPVVLKVIKRTGDEWYSGQILEAFDGEGAARVYKHVPGALLMERLRPGNSLAEIALNGRDEEATNILAEVIQRMSVPSSRCQPGLTPACATVEDWAKGFERYLSTGDEQIPKPLVAAGQATYLNLCASQDRRHLLHGDLQHYNVLWDSDRGWLAIDPKGVTGELAYEVGAAMRNPYESPSLFTSRATIERRLAQFTNKLNLDYKRALRWAFAQAVLSAIWMVEDGFAVNESNSLQLADIIRSMLPDNCPG